MTSTSDAIPLPLLTPRPPVLSTVRGEQKSESLFQMYLSSSERRATPRLEIVLEWEEHTQSSRYIRLTSDLSTFGLATRQGIPHPRGTRLKLVLHLLDGESPLPLDAEVLGPYDASGGMRLAFRSPPAEAVRRIHRFLVKQRS